MMAEAAAALGVSGGLAGCKHLSWWLGTAQEAGAVRPLFCSMLPRAVPSRNLTPRLAQLGAIAHLEHSLWQQPGVARKCL